MSAGAQLSLQRQFTCRRIDRQERHVAGLNVERLISVVKSRVLNDPSISVARERLSAAQGNP